MQKLKIMLAVIGSALALSGCSFSFPGVYKLDIQQGNVVTQDMIDQLRPGMTQRQVRFIMGNPLLQDTFHPLRWDYLYSIQPGGGTRQQERVALYFNDELTLAGLSGDFMPGVSRNEAIMGGTSNTEVNATEPNEAAQPSERPAPGSLLEEIQREVDEVKATPVPTPEPLEVE
ncbi:outer membrane protein assembly factor BamE [Atopomonas sediminilitoris]|uniref:outer membrane protein assembly factor BamE n=1 Tax=Atopomonas sediminilitoris TaxID=2919919 RepID=UPI001F4E3433|nr:outer membrane protein assembly factor BamE [Atopomonas sediminilitoris]MCJ8170702.1 outer membrane protein assembly factor BamE [Atopomonas sediminilitoris]